VEKLGQVAGLVHVATHAPFSAVKPAWQVKPQLPPLQLTVAALAGVGQTWPHVPQLFTSVFVLVHAPAQQALNPVPQTRPQAPQFERFVCTLAQVLLLQQLCPGGQQKALLPGALHSDRRGAGAAGPHWEQSPPEPAQAACALVSLG